MTAETLPHENYVHNEGGPCRIVIKCKKTEQKLLQQQWMTFGNDNKVSAGILVHNKEGITVTKSFANHKECQSEKRVKN